jgi:hypothetical protein
MMDNNTNQYQVFVYRPGVPNIMVLYSAMQIIQHNSNMTSIALYAGGYSADIVFLAFNSSIGENSTRYFHFFRSPKLPVLNVIPAQLDTQYLQVKNLSIVYIPWKYGQNLPFTHFLNMLNSETSVATNEAIFQSNTIYSLLTVDPILK